MARLRCTFSVYKRDQDATGTFRLFEYRSIDASPYYCSISFSLLSSGSRREPAA